MILFKSNLSKVNKSQIEEPTVVVASGPIVYTSIVVTATKTTSEVWLSSNVNRVVEFSPKETGFRENKGEWFGMRYLLILGAIPRL